MRKSTVASLLAALSLTVAVGCGGDAGKQCVVDGTTYKPGQSFPSPDGCNSCTCDGATGSASCTLLACAPVQCLYEGKSYNPGESFPSVDGCNTCTCGSTGVVGCTKIACTMPPATEWLAMRPVQCMGNPWQQMTSKGDGMDGIYSDPELLAIDNFFEDKGIDLVEVGFLYPPMADNTCSACTCARGDWLLVRAKAADASKLEATYGFSRLGSADGPMGGLGYTPRQCGTNPWAVTTPAMSRAEAEAVAKWTASKGASVTRAGFVQLTTPVAVCKACTCPRGDRLVASGANASDATTLRGLSFSDLPK